VSAIAPRRALLTVTGVTATHDLTLPAETDPRNVFVDAKFLQARWGKKKTAFYAYIDRIDGFPCQVVPGSWRFDHILAIEDGIADGTVTVRPSASKADPCAEADGPELDDFLADGRTKAKRQATTSTKGVR